MSEMKIAPLTHLPDDEQMFRDMVRQFAQAEVGPRAHAMDKAQKLDPELIAKCFEVGLMGIEIPEEHGGAGGTFFMSCLAVEEISRFDGAVGVFVDVQNTLVINALLRWATPAQQARFLPKLASGTVGAYALSEAGSGSDAFALKCRAIDKGDHFELTGNKLWITNGAEAGLFIVFANIDPSQGYKGITAFLVERDMAGFTVGKKEDKLGIRASSTCELILEGVRVPRENVLGEVGKGYKIAIETLNEGRIGIGAQMIGIAEGALEAALVYIQERQQFGKAIGSFQGVQFQIAQAAADLQSAKLLVYNAARLKDAGQPFIMEAAMGKLKASQVAESVTSRCVELFGGYGFTTEYPAEKFFRDAKIGQIYEGTTNMQLQTIAKMLLR